MPAAGKTNAAHLTAGTRILVAQGTTDALTPAYRKLGAKVATVTAIKPAALGNRRNRTGYDIETDLGVVHGVTGNQTFWLAPAAKPAPARVTVVEGPPVRPAKAKAKATPATLPAAARSAAATKGAATRAAKAARQGAPAKQWAKGDVDAEGFTVVWVHGYYALAKRPATEGKGFEWVAVMSDGNRLAGTSVADAEAKARAHGKANGLVRAGK